MLQCICLSPSQKKKSMVIKLVYFSLLVPSKIIFHALTININFTLQQYTCSKCNAYMELCTTPVLLYCNHKQRGMFWIDAGLVLPALFACEIIGLTLTGQTKLGSSLRLLSGCESLARRGPLTSDLAA